MKLTSQVSGLLLVGVLCLALISYFLLSQPAFTLAGAPSGVPATVATTSNPTVDTSQRIVIATSSACSARIVTTAASPVMMTFSDYAGQVPTGSFGHLQAASTTVVYDSGQYGCGLVRMYGFTSTVITVTESR